MLIRSALQPYAGTITSSPGLTPIAFKAQCKAAVPELTTKAYFLLTKLAMDFSSLLQYIFKPNPENL